MRYAAANLGKPGQPAVEDNSDRAPRCWSRQAMGSGRPLVVQPEIVERLLPSVPTLLNAVMEHTPGGSGVSPRPQSL